MKAMNQDELKQRVDAVIAMSGDDEAAHSAEDALHVDVIRAFCPEWVQAEIARLTEADFCRWCA
jgi:hypothetical protein